MLWLALGVMSFAGVVFAVWPFLRDNSRNFAVAGGAVLFVVASSAGLYASIGSPGLENERLTHGGGVGADMIEVVGGLAKRLEENPGDVNGWRMLGRSYMSLNNYPQAVAAFERVVELEDGRSAQGLVELAEALLAAEGGQTMSPRAMSLFENALAVEPNSQAALFWSGLGAFNRGDTDTAADRWERLLATNPPADIRDVIEQRVAEWRGEAPAAVAGTEQAAPAQAAAEPAPLADGAIVSASIALSDAARIALPPDAVVFVIARDPAQPSPPIAVTRRRLAELPAVVQLGDRESMVAGRE
ncbi:MAG TPA: tetratricopeptide repeat protein, partial [Pelomicrobium sp.]|nr:tetratricopeptide repeat protein [Pelomicrobium sp.]